MPCFKTYKLFTQLIAALFFIGCSHVAHSDALITSQYKAKYDVKKCGKANDGGIDYFYLDTVTGEFVQYDSEGEEEDYGSFYVSGKNKLTLVLDDEHAYNAVSEVLSYFCDSDIEATSYSPLSYQIKLNKNGTAATVKANMKVTGYDYDYGINRSGKFTYSGKGSVETD